MVGVTQEQESSTGALQSPKRCKPDVKKTTLPGEMIPRDSPQLLFTEVSRWFSFCYMSVWLMAGCKGKERRSAGKSVEKRRTVSGLGEASRGRSFPNTS